MFLFVTLEKSNCPLGLLCFDYMSAIECNTFWSVWKLLVTGIILAQGGGDGKARGNQSVLH